MRPVLSLKHGAPATDVGSISSGFPIPDNTSVTFRKLNLFIDLVTAIFTQMKKSEAIGSKRKN